MSFQMIADILYGVVKSQGKIKVACERTYPGPYDYPVTFSSLCLYRIGRVKRWKRLNRPDKIKDTRRTVPGAALMKDPLTGSRTIVMHPDLWEQIQSEEKKS